MKDCATKYFLTWKEVVQSGIQQAGGKGWNLGRLAMYGFKIPLGGVLTTRAYNEFIQHNRLQDIVDALPKLVTAENIKDTLNDDRLVQLQEKIRAASLPPMVVAELKTILSGLGMDNRPLAVRSSAAAEDSPKASFAGIHESFLNVRGFENILASVKGCYASLWSPHAVVYRRKLNISDDEIASAVVIMDMVEAQAAGVGFTCDPHTGRQNVLVVNANFGLGESVVTGAVEPDTYYLDAAPWNAVPRILLRKIGRKEGLTTVKTDGGTEFVPSREDSARQVLPDEKIEQLGLLLLRVLEALGDYDQPQDVEWVFDGRDFVLVQARPVTALARHTFAPLNNQPDIWSNGNYRDAVPMVQSPLNRRLAKTIIDTIHDASCTEIGYRLPEGIHFSRFFNGRLYCNLSALQWAWFDSMGTSPRDFNFFWGGHQPEIELKDPKPFRGLSGLKRLWHGIRCMHLIHKAKKSAPQTHARIQHSVENLAGKGFSQVKDRDFISLYDELGRIAKGYAREFTFLSATGSLPAVSLLRTLTKYFADKAIVVFNSLLVGGETGITSADHGYKLVELAGIARRDSEAVSFLTSQPFEPQAWEDQLPEGSPFRQAFREFICEYGHRAIYELDIINPRWKEDPSYLFDIIRSTLNTANLDPLKSEQREKFDQAWQEITKEVPSYKHSSIRKLVKQAQAGAAVREKTKSVLAMIIAAYRLLAQELGYRFCKQAIIKEQADIYFCTWPELVAVLTGQWDGTGLQQLILARKALQRELESISPPDIILGETPKYMEPITRISGNCLIGVPVAAGKASGIARLICHPNEGDKLQPGDVMIAPSTDPGWTPLFLKAGAVVMETGGFLSHGAIVAREYGIPAVVNIPGLMRVIKEGVTVVVDGDEGKVFFQ